MAGSTRGKSFGIFGFRVAGPENHEIRLQCDAGGWSLPHFVPIILGLRHELDMYHSDTWSGPIGLTVGRNTLGVSTVTSKIIDCQRLLCGLMMLAGSLNLPGIISVR
jgi:hypothetical protein